MWCRVGAVSEAALSAVGTITVHIIFGDQPRIIHARLKINGHIHILRVLPSQVRIDTYEPSCAAGDRKLVVSKVFFFFKPSLV